MKVFSKFFFALLFIGPLGLFGQEQDIDSQEFGLHTSGLNSLGLVYKDQVKDQVFRRYRLAALQFNAQSSSPSTNFQYNVSFSVAYEMRKSISTKLEFLHGPDFQFGLGGAENRTDLFVGLAYVLGMQYQLNEDFVLGLELLPTFRYQFSNSPNNSQDNFALQANAQNAYIFIVHQF